MVQSRNQSHKQPGILLRSLLGLATVAPLVWAQAPPGASGGGPSRALTLPLSGQTGMAGSASAQQTVNPGSGVSTVNSSVQVSGNLNGSISGGEVPPGAIRLTLADAIKRGLATNLGPISSANAQAQASANRLQGRSALLPNI